MSDSQVVIFSKCERLAPSPARARSRRARHSRAWSCTGRPAAALPRAVTPEQKISFAPPPSGTTRAGGNRGAWLIGRFSWAQPPPVCLPDASRASDQGKLGEEKAFPPQTPPLLFVGLAFAAWRHPTP